MPFCITKTFVGQPQADSTASSALQVNDMVLSVNGKLVGGMTELQLDIELEISGSHLILVVSRYKHAKHARKKFLEVERRILNVMDSAARDDRLIGWTEIGNGDIDSTNSSEEHHQAESIVTTSAEEESVTSAAIIRNEALGQDRASDCEVSLQGCDPSTEYISDVEEEQHASEEESSPISTAGKCYELPTKSPTNQTRPCIDLGSSKVEEMVSIPNQIEDDGNWSHDKNAWLGCVCGKVHGESEEGVFWLQCDSCDSWYDVSEKCVGFTHEEALRFDSWTCSACPSSTPTASKDCSAEPTVNETTPKNEMSRPSGSHCHGNKQANSCNRKNETRIEGCGRLKRSDQSANEEKCPETPVYDSIPTHHIGKRTDSYHIGDLVYVKAHAWPGTSSLCFVW